jgi:hypothetical protein
MHTTTHILAWLPSEYMRLGDLTPAFPLFYPNLIYLHVGWATTAAFRSLTILQKNGGTDTKPMGRTEKKSFQF